MIKIGGTEIVDIAVGSIPIKKAYIGSQLVWEKSSPVLPYDAEVEYIQSSGTQYIDTGIIYDSTVKVETKMRLLNRAACSLFGLYYNDGTARRWSLTTGSNNGRLYYYLNTVTNKYKSFTANTWYTFILDNRYLTMNGTRYDSGASAFSTGTYEVPIYLFCRHNYQPNNNVSREDMLGSIGQGYTKIWKGGVLVRDYISVRVGTVGCLYDKVSGTLFYSSGSSDFTAGPDVT